MRLSDEEAARYRKDLLLEVSTQLHKPLLPEEITVQMVVNEYGVSHDVATDRLDRMVKAGQLTWRWTIVNGNRCKAFARVLSEHQPCNSNS